MATGRANNNIVASLQGPRSDGGHQRPRSRPFLLPNLWVSASFKPGRCQSGATHPTKSARGISFPGRPWSTTPLGCLALHPAVFNLHGLGLCDGVVLVNSPNISPATTTPGQSSSLVRSSCYILSLTITITTH
jgi:hypothetical protein